jgi:hypothetical protein
MYYVDKKGKPDDSNPFNKKKQATTVSQPIVTAINDVVFDNYHQFRGEVRMLPSITEERDGNLAHPASATVPATPPRQ